MGKEYGNQMVDILRFYTDSRINWRSLNKDTQLKDIKKPSI